MLLRQTALLCRSLSAFPPASASLARTFTITTPTLSQVGREPIVLPPNVTLTTILPAPSMARVLPPRKLEISGPNGTINFPIPHYLTLTMTPPTAQVPGKVVLSVLEPDDRTQRSMWGTIRRLLFGHITGVTEGHIAILRLVGVGYRAVMEQNGKIVNLKVGYAHPIELKVPDGVKASVPTPTRILLEGPEKMIVKQFAANIRAWRVPEPYKGKGIFVDDETIKTKAKKIK